MRARPVPSQTLARAAVVDLDVGMGKAAAVLVDHDVADFVPLAAAGIAELKSDGRFWMGT
jgi:hypothetical protein